MSHWIIRGISCAPALAAAFALFAPSVFGQAQRSVGGLKRGTPAAPSGRMNQALGQGMLFRNDVRHMLPVNDQSSTAVAYGDVDGDGDLDAVVAQYWDKNHLYLNDGNGVFSDATAQFPDIGEGTQAVALGDVDGDGDLDAFLGNGHAEYVQPNRLFLNDGSGVFTDATSRIPWDSDNTVAVALGDVDGDGDLDAFIGNLFWRDMLGFSGPEQNLLYLNDGHGVFTDATPQIPGHWDYTNSVALGDADSDGDLDVLIGNSQGQNRFYVNDGSGVFTDATPRIPVDSDDTSAVALGDVDGDGDLDAFIGNSGQNRLYLNDGTGWFTDGASQIPVDADDTSAVALGDVDGDGDLDAFLGVYGQNRIYVNDGRGIFVDAPNQVPVGEAHAVALGDVDGDGDLDALLVRNPLNRLCLNDGHGFFADVTAPFPEDSDSTKAVALGDVDEDGDLDAFIGNSEQNRLYLNDGTGGLADATNQIPSAGASSYSVALGDVDGDDDLDALVGNNGQNNLYLNDGNGFFTDSTYQIPADSDDNRAVALGDVDGDGDLDALVANRGQNRLYLNDGSGVFTDATTQIPPDSDETHAVALGDVDGDNDLDVFLGNARTGHPITNRLYLNDGNGYFIRTSGQIPWDDDFTTAVALGDVDGDGDLDAFIGNRPVIGSSGQNRLYLNDGNGFFSDATAQIPVDTISVLALALGDVDGDGSLDAFFGTSTQNRLYLNDGNGGFADATVQIPEDYVNTHAVAFGDVDGDGDLDAFVGNEGGHQNLLHTNMTRQLAWRGIPRVGKPLTMDLHGAPGNIWLLAWALDSAEIPLPPWGTLRLDPATLQVADMGLLDGDGFATLSWLAPNDPALVGVSFHLQAVIGAPLRLSNREEATFTNL